MTLSLSYSLTRLQPPLWLPHGPQQWPQWRLFAVSFVRIGVCPPSQGLRLWVCTRRGAISLDAILYRRSFRA